MRSTGASDGISSAVVSAALGAALGYIFFVVLLQTPSVSITRLAATTGVCAAAASINYVICTKWLRRGRDDRRGYKDRTALALVLPLLLLPLLYRTPGYPESPLLRPWTEITVEIVTSRLQTAPPALATEAIRLDLDKGHAVLRDDFNPDAGWQIWEATSSAPAGGGTRFHWSGRWTGTTSERAVLKVMPPPVAGELNVYWDNAVTRIRLEDGTPTVVDFKKTARPPWGYDAALFVSIYAALAWALVILLRATGSRCERLAPVEGTRLGTYLLLLLLAGLTVLLVKVQVDNLPDGILSLGNLQLPRHDDILHGVAPSPWQYRILSEMLAEGIIQVLQLAALEDAHVPAFLALRLLQNAAIFLLAYLLYRRLSGSWQLACIGTLILAASMGRAFYDADLSFSTYADIIFYLAAAVLLLGGNYTGVAVIMPWAALNRETSGLIPLLALAAGAAKGRITSQGGLLVLACSASYAVVFFGLRLLYPNRPLFIPYHEPPGLSLLVFNVTRQLTWQNLFSTLGLIPLLGLAGLQAWPRLWRLFLYALVPAWIVIHFVAAVAAESRLFLVPQALIFIPGALFVLRSIVSPTGGLSAGASPGMGS